MSLSDRRGSAQRAVVCLGVAAALSLGACGTTDAGAAPPLPTPGAPAPPAGQQDAAPVSAPAEPWDSIARCETGGDWHADTGNGYQGGLQLSMRTWTAYGGGQFAPRADKASRDQQVLVGDRVRAREGWQAWSGCAG